MEGEQNVPRWFRYVVPWTGRSITPNSVDLLLSTDAMEHVDDVAGAIRAMRSFVKPDGWVSHIINFTSEGTTEAWNGHWGYGDLRWKLLRGRRLWQLNRLWLSAYLSAFEERGFALRHVARTSAIPSFFFHNRLI